MSNTSEPLSVCTFAVWQIKNLISLHMLYNLKSKGYINTCICVVSPIYFIILRLGSRQESHVSPSRPSTHTYILYFLFIFYYPSLLNYAKIANVNVSVLRERKPELDNTLQISQILPKYFSIILVNHYSQSHQRCTKKNSFWVRCIHLIIIYNCLLEYLYRGIVPGASKGLKTIIVEQQSI